MNLYTYDIWSGSKGIIFANSKEQAKELFRKEYPDTQIFPDDVDDYDEDICRIDWERSNIELEPILIETLC